MFNFFFKDFVKNFWIPKIGQMCRNVCFCKVSVFIIKFVS